MKPLKRVPIEWSANFAYCIGLIASDGNLSKDGRHIIYVSKDLDLIQIFCAGLKISPKIATKFSGNKNPTLSYYVQFSDVNFYKFLLSIGITPNKSKTIGKINIPSKFFRDFLRGSFDGDGCFYSYFDKRWRSSHLFYFCFISASSAHLTWIREEIIKLLGITGNLTTYKKQRVIQLKYAKREAIKIIQFVYYKANLLSLERKRQKVYNALAVEQKNNSARVL